MRRRTFVREDAVLAIVERYLTSEHSRGGLYLVDTMVRERM
jgi:hypothetical protein